MKALEVVVHDGFPVTTPMRTLAELAATEPRPRVERAYEQADRLGLLDIEQLARECAGRPGARVLKALIAEGREAPPSKTELERTLLDVCRDHGVPYPARTSWCTASRWTRTGPRSGWLWSSTAMNGIGRAARSRRIGEGTPRWPGRASARSASPGGS